MNPTWRSLSKGINICWIWSIREFKETETHSVRERERVIKAAGEYDNFLLRRCRQRLGELYAYFCKCFRWWLFALILP